jgi:hypothetical protein
VLDWFSRLSPSVAAALVSLLVTVLTLVVSGLVGPSVKFAFDKRLEGQKLELAYRWEQRKALKDHIARHRGRFLESAEALAQRLWNYQENQSQGWLNLHGSHFGAVAYYPLSFAHRLLHCLSAARSMEREALFIDTSVAADDDTTFLKALKLTTQVWTDTGLFGGVAYDQAEASDHFFKDNLRSMAEQFATVEGAMSLNAFEAAVAKEDHPYIDVFRFVDGLNRSETRHRHDRVTCAQLVLIATLNRFGYDFQGTDDEATRQVIGYVREPAVLMNLVVLIKRMHLDSDHEFQRLIALIDGVRVVRT